MAILPVPFADFFNASTPLDEFEALCSDVRDVFGAAGGYEHLPGLIRIDTPTGSGTVKLHRPNGGRVGCVSVSGQALAALRAQRRSGDLLWAIGMRPHRVTLLHATIDLPIEAPPFLAALYAKAVGAEGIALSRKRIPRRHISRVLGPGYPGDVETGTVYLGNRKADVWAKAYDKRSELHAAASRGFPEGAQLVGWFNDPGPLTRIELALGRHVGCTLRDVEDPTAVFWHYAGNVLLPRPEGVPIWTPGAEGYELGPRPERLPAQQLKLLIDRSPDVARMLRLAADCGAHGFGYLTTLLRRQGESAAAANLRPPAPAATNA